MNSYRVTVLAKESDTIRKLVNALIRKGYVCNIIFDEAELAGNAPTDLLLIEPGNGLVDFVLEEMTERIKQDRDIRILMLVEKDILQDIGNDINIDDFVLKPYELSELISTHQPAS